MKRIFKTLGWLVVASLVFYSFYYMWKQSQPEPVVYECVRPAERDIVNKVTATGVLEARVQVYLKPKVTGIIEKLKVAAGDRVRKGDEIARIRVIPDIALLNEAQSRVEMARIDLERMKVEAGRSQALFEQGAISLSEYEDMQYKVSKLEEELAAAYSQIDVITTGVSGRSASTDNTVVKASMDGIVLNVPVKVGSTVSGASQFSEGTTIAKIADMSEIIFKGEIDEMQVADLAEGMTVSLVPAAMPSTSIPAVLNYIAPEGNLVGGTHKFEIKAEAMVPEDVTVRSGYSANASIEVRRATGVLSLDEACIAFEDGTPYVYCLVSDPEDKGPQQWERIPVTLGLSDGQFIEIKNGVTKEMMIRAKKIK